MFHGAQPGKDADDLQRRVQQACVRLLTAQPCIRELGSSVPGLDPDVVVPQWIHDHASERDADREQQQFALSHLVYRGRNASTFRDLLRRFPHLTSIQLPAAPRFDDDTLQAFLEAIAAYPHNGLRELDGLEDSGFDTQTPAADAAIIALVRQHGAVLYDVPDWFLDTRGVARHCTAFDGTLPSTMLDEHRADSKATFPGLGVILYDYLVESVNHEAEAIWFIDNNGVDRASVTDFEWRGEHGTAAGVVKAARRCPNVTRLAVPVDMDASTFRTLLRGWPRLAHVEFHGPFDMECPPMPNFEVLLATLFESGDAPRLTGVKLYGPRGPVPVEIADDPTLSPTHPLLLVLRYAATHQPNLKEL